MRSPVSSRGIVVLLHGVNGHHLDSWGPIGQPGTFAERLRRDLSGVDVLSYAYRSPLGVSPERPPANLATLVEEWTRFMRRTVTSDIDRVALVGHCLGGLIARFGLPELLNSRLAGAHPSPLRWALHALDTPEDWSDGPLREPLASIVATLGLHESAMRANAAWWRDRNGPAAWVDDHAVISTQPSWVAPFKRGSSVAHTAYVDVPHVELTRAPLTGDHAAYEYVAKHLATHFQTAFLATHG